MPVASGMPGSTGGRGRIMFSSMNGAYNPGEKPLPPIYRNPPLDRQGQDAAQPPFPPVGSEESHRLGQIPESDAPNLRSPGISIPPLGVGATEPDIRARMMEQGLFPEIPSVFGGPAPIGAEAGEPMGALAYSTPKRPPAVAPAANGAPVGLGGRTPAAAGRVSPPPQRGTAGGASPGGLRSSVKKAKPKGTYGQRKAAASRPIAPLSAKFWLLNSLARRDPDVASLLREAETLPNLAPEFLRQVEADIAGSVATAGRGEAGLAELEAEEHRVEVDATVGVLSALHKLVLHYSPATPGLHDLQERDRRAARNEQMAGRSRSRAGAPSSMSMYGTSQTPGVPLPGPAAIGPPEAEVEYDEQGYRVGPPPKRLAPISGEGAAEGREGGGGRASPGPGGELPPHGAPARARSRTSFPKPEGPVQSLPSYVPPSDYVVDSVPMWQPDGKHMGQFDRDRGSWQMVLFPALQPGTREDVERLEEWLECKEVHMGITQDTVPNVLDGFLLYSIGILEVVRQVHVHCAERGALLLHLWNRYCRLFETVLARGEPALLQKDEEAKQLREQLEAEQRRAFALERDLLAKDRELAAGPRLTRKLSRKSSNSSKMQRRESQGRHQSRGESPRNERRGSLADMFAVDRAKLEEPTEYEKEEAEKERVKREEEKSRRAARAAKDEDGRSYRMRRASMRNDAADAAAAAADAGEEGGVAAPPPLTAADRALLATPHLSAEKQQLLSHMGKLDKEVVGLEAMVSELREEIESNLLREEARLAMAAESGGDAGASELQGTMKMVKEKIPSLEEEVRGLEEALSALRSNISVQDEELETGGLEVAPEGRYRAVLRRMDTIKAKREVGRDVPELAEKVASLQALLLDITGAVAEHDRSDDASEMARLTRDVLHSHMPPLSDEVQELREHVDVMLLELIDVREVDAANRLGRKGRGKSGKGRGGKSRRRKSRKERRRKNKGGEKEDGGEGGGGGGGEEEGDEENPVERGKRARAQLERRATILRGDAEDNAGEDGKGKGKRRSRRSRRRDRRRRRGRRGGEGESGSEDEDGSGSESEGGGGRRNRSRRRHRRRRGGSSDSRSGRSSGSGSSARGISDEGSGSGSDASSPDRRRRRHRRRRHRHSSDSGFSDSSGSSYSDDSDQSSGSSSYDSYDDSDGSSDSDGSRGRLGGRRGRRGGRGKEASPEEQLPGIATRCDESELVDDAVFADQLEAAVHATVEARRATRQEKRAAAAEGEEAVDDPLGCSKCGADLADSPAVAELLEAVRAGVEAKIAARAKAQAAKDVRLLKSQLRATRAALKRCQDIAILNGLEDGVKDIEEQVALSEEQSKAEEAALLAETEERVRVALLTPVPEVFEAAEAEGPDSALHDGGAEGGEDVVDADISAASSKTVMAFDGSVTRVWSRPCQTMQSGPSRRRRSSAASAQDIPEEEGPTIIRLARRSSAVGRSAEKFAKIGRGGSFQLNEADKQTVQDAMAAADEYEYDDMFDETDKEETEAEYEEEVEETEGSSVSPPPRRGRRRRSTHSKSPSKSPTHPARKANPFARPSSSGPNPRESALMAGAPRPSEADTIVGGGSEGEGGEGEEGGNPFQRGGMPGNWKRAKKLFALPLGFKKFVGKRKAKPKPFTVRQLSKIIHEIYIAKILADHTDEQAGRERMTCCEFAYAFLLNKYGLKGIAESALQGILKLLRKLLGAKAKSKAIDKVSPKIRLFAAFCGMCNPLPESDLAMYLRILDRMRNKPFALLPETDDADLFINTLHLGYFDTDPDVEMLFDRDIFNAMMRSLSGMYIEEVIRDADRQRLLKCKRVVKLDYDLVLEKMLALPRKETDPDLSAANLELLFRAGDIDQDGVLEYGDFCAVLNAAQNGIQSTLILKMFRECLTLEANSIETIRSKSFVAIAKSRGVRAPSYVIWQVLTRSFNKCQSHIMKDLDDEETTRMTQLRVRIRKNMATKEALVETLDMIQSFVPAFVKFKAMIL